MISCELSTKQEMSLNKSIKDLIIARNNGDALSYLDYTHPIITKHYKSQDDDVFRERFQSVKPKTSRDVVNTDEVYWQNTYQKKVKSNDEYIQVEIEVSLVKGYDHIDSTHTIYAITKLESNDWLFVEQQDYFSNYFPKKLRLFDKE